MAVDRQASFPPSTWARLGGLVGGGTTGNERLTSAAGAVLIVLLAVIGVTIIALGPLLSVHLFVGMLLVGPVLLKLAGTGYRFARYYTANPRYRRKGPPALPLRMIAPIVILSTLVVFVSGIALLFAGPSSREALLPIHKVSFIVWVAFMAIHVLAHLPTMLRSLSADYGPAHMSTSAKRGAWQQYLGSRDSVNGRAGRTLSLTSALAFGVVLAIVLIPQYGPWLSAHNLHH
ncbi:MAG: hypothetical protein ACHQHO_09115 [Solirubrobacterales bacterium]